MGTVLRRLPLDEGECHDILLVSALKCSPLVWVFDSGSIYRVGISSDTTCLAELSSSVTCVLFTASLMAIDQESSWAEASRPDI